MGVILLGIGFRRVNAPTEEPSSAAWMSRPARLAAMCVTLAIAGYGVFLVTGNDPPTPARLTTPITGPFGASLPATTSARPYTFGSIPICLDKAGTVHIDSVSPVDPQGGLTVTGFAARPLSPNLFGSQDESLARVGFDGSDVVTRTCEQPPGGAELAVEFRKEGENTARADGILVSWHNESDHGEIRIPFHIVLCEGPVEFRSLRFGYAA